MFESNARRDLVSTERRCQLKSVSLRSPHDLRFVIANRRFHCRDRFGPSQSAGIDQARAGANLAEALSALWYRRDCPSEFGLGLVFLAPGHDGDGGILQLSPPADDRSSDWLCARASIRGRISRCSRAGHSLLTRGRAFIGDRKSTRLNSSHTVISYAVFCLKKKKKKKIHTLYGQSLISITTVVRKHQVC